MRSAGNLMSTKELFYEISGEMLHAPEPNTDTCLQYHTSLLQKSLCRDVHPRWSTTYKVCPGIQNNVFILKTINIRINNLVIPDLFNALPIMGGRTSFSIMTGK